MNDAQKLSWFERFLIKLAMTKAAARSQNAYAAADSFLQGLRLIESRTCAPDMPLMSEMIPDREVANRMKLFDEDDRL
jgi:hypothetical protein